MPNDGVQRGSIMKIVGDPLTPLYPAKPTIYKTRDIEKVNLRKLYLKIVVKISGEERQHYPEYPSLADLIYYCI